MKNVAIIDDNPRERFVLRGLVEDMGFNVVAEGENGRDAVEICMSVSPDLLIMDVHMPVKDGIEAASAISKRCPTPVVLLTGRDDEDIIRRAVDSGVMAFLVKPVRTEELVAAMELSLSRFREFRLLREENETLKNTLEARKLIEKAKGLIMEKEGVSEAEAFKRIRKISMDKRKSMKEIAEVIILALEGRPSGG